MTSDNPRGEPPEKIIGQIEEGMRGSAHIAEADRRKGIECALDMCREGDTVVIAGKGHEDTQEICGVKRHFSDAETVRELLK